MYGEAEGMLLLSEESGQTITPREKIGISNLPDQLVRDADYSFNLMILGEPSSGKKSLAETLLGIPMAQFQECRSRTTTGPRITEYRAVLREGAVKCKFGVALATDIGSQMDKSSLDKVVVGALQRKFEVFLEAEISTTRSAVRDDTRIHACIYMLSPTGREVKESDLLIMRAIHHRVNLIPVIAKADGFTESELSAFKESVTTALQTHGIQVFTPTHPEVRSAYEAGSPLATVSSREQITVGGRAVRVRQYPWGVVEVENPKHSQVGKLRDLVLRDCTYELIQSTHSDKYEAFRHERLVKIGFKDHDPEGKPIPLAERIEAKRRDIDGSHDDAVRELRQKFVKMANEKEAQFIKAREELSENYAKLTEIHTQEETKYRKQLEELTAQREAWEASRTKGKDKGRK